jgi:hypothetical protein
VGRLCGFLWLTRKKKAKDKASFYLHPADAGDKDTN